MSASAEVLIQLAKDYLLTGASPLAGEYIEEWAELTAEIDAIRARGQVVDLLD